MYKVYDGKCFYTGEYLTDFEIDHIFPKSLGGKDCVANYVLCKKGINRLKYNRTKETFSKIVTETVNLLYNDKIVYLLNKRIKIKKEKIKSNLNNKESFKLINENRIKNLEERTRLKLLSIIENWNFDEFGTISQVKIIKNNPISKKTVEKYYRLYKDIVIKMNEEKNKLWKRSYIP